MKRLAQLTLLALGALSLQAGIVVDVVVAEEDVASQTLPFTCDVVQSERGATLMLALKEPFGVMGRFDAYELRVLKRPVSVSELKNGFFRLDLVARRERRREKSVIFEVKDNEILCSYLVVSSWMGRENGMSKVRSLCVPIAALLKR